MHVCEARNVCIKDNKSMAIDVGCKIKYFKKKKLKIKTKKKKTNLHCTSSRSDTFNGCLSAMWWTKHVIVALWCARSTRSSLASLRAPTFWSLTVSLRLSTWYGTSGASSNANDPKVNSHDNDGFGLPPSTTHETVRSAFSLTGIKRFPGSNILLSIKR